MKLTRQSIVGTILLMFLLTFFVRAETVIKSGFVLETFSLTSVGTSATGSEETLALAGYSDGIIKNIGIASDSTNYKISIYDKTGASADSINELAVYSAINLTVSDDGLNLFFANNDTVVASKLYAVIINSDATTATGTTTLNIGLEN